MLVLLAAVFLQCHAMLPPFQNSINSQRGLFNMNIEIFFKDVYLLVNTFPQYYEIANRLILQKPRQVE